MNEFHGMYQLTVGQVSKVEEYERSGGKDKSGNDRPKIPCVEVTVIGFGMEPVKCRADQYEYGTENETSTYAVLSALKVGQAVTIICGRRKVKLDGKDAIFWDPIHAVTDQKHLEYMVQVMTGQTIKKAAA